MGKFRFTAMAVSTSAKRFDTLVDVLYVYVVTVDSYIGKLRAILLSTVRDGEWDKRLGQPSVYKPVKVFLRLVAAEQLQATPFFLSLIS